MLPIETLGYLLNIGYSLEQQSSEGLTSLLFAATQHSPHLIKCLRLFIERGANPDATNFKGQGVLHCALAPPDIYDDWSSTLQYSYRRRSYHSTDEAVWAARMIFNTESDYHEDDYDDEGVDPGLLLDKINKLCHTANSASDEYSIDHIFCENDDRELEMIRSPMQVLKKRTRFKLLTLLQLGCDPNVVYHQGLSPSDYAMRDSLWPQWSWALLNAGYFLHEQNGWVKSSLFDRGAPRGQIDEHIL